MSDFLLELRSEEIPARMQAGARDELVRRFTDAMAKAGLAIGDVETFSTPRRLILIARDLPDATAATREETKGPRTTAPPQALEGFLRKTGLSREQLTERDGVLFAVVERPGRATIDVLAEAIPAIVRAFSWPKSMRWGTASRSQESLRWVRPLSGIVVLFGEAIVPVEIDGVAASATTLGHRFHHPGPITIGSASDYAEKLRACHVVVDHVEREGIVRELARAAAIAAGLTLVEDEGLVVENAGLTEWPVPLLGRFDAAFLDVPPEVIRLTMRTNQKYFACVDGDGALANAFVCTANIDATDGGAALVAGNQRVLSARLADARFFWDNDLKVPLEARAAKLGDIVFHEKLGTVADKVDRVAKLARWLVEEGIVGGKEPHPAERQRGAQPSASEVHPGSASRSARTGSSLTLGQEELANLAERAARLCKADLVTGMVGEFPELQGIIGGHLARAQGEDPRVADAIRDHYKPVGQGDDVPTAPVTVAVALADKLDTIGLFFSAGKRPTGSKDPYALRRACLGILELIVLNRLRLSVISALMEVRRIWLSSLANYPATLDRGDTVDGYLDWEEVPYGAVYAAPDRISFYRDYSVTPMAGFEMRAGLAERKAVIATVEAPLQFVEHSRTFLADRLKAQQREAGVRHDLIDAVFALGGEDDLVRLLARVRALQAFMATADGAEMLAGYKRAANILKKEGGAPTAVTPAPAGVTLEEPAEAALVAALDAAEPRAAAAVAAEDFGSAMTALASLRVPVDAFFESVTVNDPDPATRARRLALLERVRSAMHSVADFSKIEG